MFSISKYYNLIKRIEYNKIATFVIYGLLGYLIGTSFATIAKAITMSKKTSTIPIIICIAVGIYIAYQRTLSLDIKMQKMYWEIDIYNKLNKITENEK